MSNAHVRGWQNQRRGSQLESDVIAQVAMDANVVAIKQHVETQFVGRGKAIVVGEAWPDFILFVRTSAYFFDTKSTGNAKAVSMPKDREHQFERLRHMSALGLPAFYLVHWRQHEVYEAFPVTIWSNWPFRCRYYEGVVRARGDKWLGEILEGVIDAEIK